MNNAVKNLLKKTPLLQWFLGRIDKLEKELQTEKNKQEASINQLVALEKEHTEKLAQLEKRLKDEMSRRDRHIRQLKDQDYALRREMNYLYYKGLDPSKYAENLKEWYKNNTGKILNLEHPQTYNEKIQWIKLYDSTPLKTRLADKYLVREWIAEKIGGEYLVPLIGVYDKFDDIDFDRLPDKFVVKANHGSGWNIIVRDKAQFNKEEAKKKINSWLSKNFAFVCGLELHYLNIPPKIIIENYLEGHSELIEYRFMCFGGEVKFIYVNNAHPINYRRTLFTPDWHKMNVTIKHPAVDYEIPKPKTLDKMLELARKLGQGFPHVRVDFFEMDGKIYFGEMTFTFGSGIQKICPEEFDLEMGNWIVLPEKSKLPVSKRI